MVTVSVKERRGTNTVRGDRIWMKHLVGFQIRHLFFRGDDPTDESDSKSIVLLAALPNIEIKMQFQNECIAQTCSRAPPIYFLKVTLDETWTEPENGQDQILNHSPWTGSCGSPVRYCGSLVELKMS